MYWGISCRNILLFVECQFHLLNSFDVNPHTFANNCKTYRAVSCSDRYQHCSMSLYSSCIFLNHAVDIIFYQQLAMRTGAIEKKSGSSQSMRGKNPHTPLQLNFSDTIHTHKHKTATTESCRELREKRILLSGSWSFIHSSCGNHCPITQMQSMRTVFE